MGPYSGCDPDLIFRLIDLFQKVVVLLLEQGVLDMDEVPYLIHFSHANMSFIFSSRMRSMTFFSHLLLWRVVSGLPEMILSLILQLVISLG